MIGVRNTTKIASISLDIRKNSTVENEPIVLRQGDSDVIIETSISNDGYPDLEISFATFVAKKPDGTIISNDPANVSGNVISYHVSKHLTESVGKIQDAYFMINNETTTNGFDISIIPSTQLDDTSVNYIPGIENINKFLESAEADWLGRIQQMKTQIDGLNIPDEFKLLMDKALSDAKNQYQPTIDAAEQNVENIVADLAAKKLDLTNNSDELNKTITTIQTQVASVNSFLDNVQKQIIDANTSFTTDQQNKVSQSIADGQKKLADSIADSQKKLADSIASMQSEVAQTVADTKTSIQQIQQSAKNANDSIQNLQIGGRNLLPGTSGTVKTVTNASGFSKNLPSITPVVTKTDSDTTYTASAWLSSASHGMRVQLAWADSSGTYHYENGAIISGGKSGYSTWTGTVPAGSTLPYVAIIFVASQSTPSTVSYKEMKLEKGSIATDWCPAWEDKADESKVVELQTQVDNSAVGTNLFTGTSDFTGWTLTGGTAPGTTDGLTYAHLFIGKSAVAPDLTLAESTTYTLSFDALGNIAGTTPISIGYSKDSQGNIIASDSVNATLNGPDGPSVRVSLTFTTPSSFTKTNFNIGCGNDFHAVWGSIFVRHAKLELGSHATDWCPNPSEILTQSDYAKIKAAIVALKGSLS